MPRFSVYPAGMTDVVAFLSTGSQKRCFMKGMFVEFVRILRDPVRARRQEKIREVELTWSDHDLSNFRVFAMGLQPAEMADVCHALADATAIPLLEVLVDYTGINNELMLLAFQSLEKVPASARLFLAGRMLASPNPVVRAGACTMLGGVGAPATEALTGALGDGSDLVEAVAGLLRAVREEKSGLADTAGRALTGMEPEAIIPTLATILRGGDLGMAMTAADLLGNMRTSRAAAVLGDVLAEETRSPLVAVIADAIGKSGATGAWKVLHRKLLKDNPESMPLLSSLADSAREENLDDFALLLDRLPESGAGELVLRRLAAFSRTVKPSPAILSRALSVLDSGNRGLAIPAVEILVYSGEESLRVRILTEIACIGSEMPTRRLLREMLKFKDGDLSALFKGTGPETACLIEDAAAEADYLGTRGEELFRKMGARAREGVECAVDAVREAARLDPAQLIAAMRHSPHQVYLLEAWAGLSQRDRLNHQPDLDALFAAADTADRRMAMAILSRLGEERYLRRVAMSAFSDSDTEVRTAAATLVRKLVGADS